MIYIYNLKLFYIFNYIIKLILWYKNWHVCIFKIHYVALNGFENNVIICWYIIFYELVVFNFIIKMYYVIQNEFILILIFFIWTKYEKNNDG